MAEASKMCKRLGLVLLAVETVLEKDKITSILGLSSKIFFFKLILTCDVKAGAKDVFWTSGSGEGEFCALESKFAWCSVGSSTFVETEVPSQLWWTPNATSTGRCMSLQIDSGRSGLIFNSCTHDQKFICEVNFNKYLTLNSNLSLLASLNQSQLLIVLLRFQQM